MDKKHIFCITCNTRLKNSDKICLYQNYATNGAKWCYCHVVANRICFPKNISKCFPTTSIWNALVTHK